MAQKNVLWVSLGANIRSHSNRMASLINATMMVNTLMPTLNSCHSQWKLETRGQRWRVRVPITYVKHVR